LRCKRGVEGRRNREEQKPKSWMQLEFSVERRDLKKGEEEYVGWRERERERVRYEVNKAARASW
jgi:hypothetical protein